AEKGEITLQPLLKRENHDEAVRVGDDRSAYQMTKTRRYCLGMGCGVTDERHLVTVDRDLISDRSDPDGIDDGSRISSKIEEAHTNNGDQLAFEERKLQASGCIGRDNNRSGFQA